MLTGWRDFDDTLRALSLLQRRFDDVFEYWGAPGGPAVFEHALRAPRTPWPAVNAFETPEAFVYKAEVPGLAERDVSVHVEDETLVLRGERKTQAPQGYEVRLRERAPVAFARKLPLPGRIDGEGVTATLKDGVLTVTLPKAKETLPRQIAVKSA
jgi:HSP20 family protein